MFKTKLTAAGLLILAVASIAYGDERGNWQYVTGTAIHFESDGLEHSVVPTANGVIRRSTDIVELSGDLEGRVLFQPVSVIDLVDGTMVNTGTQVFSGTVLGSEPVVLGDDKFRFDVDLNTGETNGDIFLTDRISGPNLRCILHMQGTGRTPEGYNLSVYWGTCKVK